MSDAKLRFLSWMRRGLARTVTGTGTIQVGVNVNGVPVTHAIRMRGPGDVIGLSPAQVLRMEPPDGTADFEPNYLAAVELASPDLPWMFTPAAPVADRLTPWLVLIVVEEKEGVTLARAEGAPLPILSIGSPAKAADELPDLSEAWAWAHVQSSIALEGDVAAALARQPEAFVARLICPRRLAIGTGYLACVVPSFAQGVHAGRGEAVDPSDLSSAWSPGVESVSLPVYCSWRFRTGPSGDFESLVRKLRPRELGPSVGLHDLDVGSPGGALPEAPGTLLSYQGALRSRSAKPRVWDEPHRGRFRSAMHALLTQSSPETNRSGYQPLRDDPVVAPPSYGLAPTGHPAVPSSGDPVWLGDANLGPVERATAGLGAEVVRRNQEQLMAQAWEQARPLRRINLLLARSRLAAEIGIRWKGKLEALGDAALVQVAAPSLARITDATYGTMTSHVATLKLPGGVVTAAFKRAVRRGSTIGKALGGVAKTIDPSAKLAQRLVVDAEVMLGYAALTRPVGTSIDQPVLQSTSRVSLAARAAGPSDAIDKDVVIEHRMLVMEPAIAKTKLGEAATRIRDGLDPVGTIGARLRASITAPAEAWGTHPVPERMVVTPVLDDPAYEMLVRISPEYMLPGLGTVPDDTVALLAPNDAFVETFLLGANQELARELLWREYPADLTDTWMRRFWDAPNSDGDVPSIDEWNPGMLGTHVTRGAKTVGVVLLVKGKLLRRYPDTRVYAVKAKWNGDHTERIEDTAEPPRAPIFSGALGRDAWFYAFDLKQAQARGDADGLGWFVVFEEQPTGPRFGLDVEKKVHAGDQPRFWTDLSWGHLVETIDELDKLTNVPVVGPLARLAGAMHRFDAGEFEETWGVDSAAMARITFQRPVRVLRHMDGILPEEQI